jgi:hypothetical protein
MAQEDRRGHYRNQCIFRRLRLFLMVYLDHQKYSHFRRLTLGRQKLSHGPQKVKSFSTVFPPGQPKILGLPEVNEFSHERYSRTGPHMWARTHSLTHAATAKRCRSPLPLPRTAAHHQHHCLLSAAAPASSKCLAPTPSASSFNLVPPPEPGPSPGVLRAPTPPASSFHLKPPPPPRPGPANLGRSVPRPALPDTDSEADSNAELERVPR